MHLVILMAVQIKLMLMALAQLHRVRVQGSQRNVKTLLVGLGFFITPREGLVIGGWSKGCGPLLLMNLFFSAVFTN